MLLAYVMIPLIQRELDTFINSIWNPHRIRNQKNTALPDGVPNHIYSFPEEYFIENCNITQVHLNNQLKIIKFFHKEQNVICMLQTY